MALHPAFTSPANGSSMRPPITVLIVDSNELSRSGLRVLLEADPRFEIVGDMSTDADTLAARSQPDLTLLDPARHGTIDQNIIERLRQSAPLTRVVVLTTVFEPHSFMATMLQQVHGYLLKDSDIQGEFVREALMSPIAVD